MTIQNCVGLDEIAHTVWVWATVRALCTDWRERILTLSRLWVTHYIHTHTNFILSYFFVPSHGNLHIFLSDRLEKTAGTRETSHATDLTPFQEPSSKVSGITPRYPCRRRRRRCINPFECACESAASLMCHLAKQTCQSRNLKVKFAPMLRREQKQS